MLANLLLVPFTVLLFLPAPTLSTPAPPLTRHTDHFPFNLTSLLALPTATDNDNCWRPPGQTLIYKSCLDLIKNRLGSPHPLDIPMTFSRRRHTDILIPYLAPGADCNVVLGIRKDALSIVVERWDNIKAVAREVALRCVVHPPHLGGWGWAGGGELLVSVIGKNELRRLMLDGMRGKKEEAGGKERRWVDGGEWAGSERRIDGGDL